MLKEKDKNWSLKNWITDWGKDPITWDGLWKMCLFYGALIVAIILLFKFVIMLNLIPSGSMENTIMTGDIVIATRFDKTDIQRYDIMVFIPPDHPDTYYIKRVIGLPGETILVKDGKVYAGYELLDDSFVSEEMGRSGDGVYEVPEGCYFMMGDNRNHSADARFWENKYVPLENMVAKARIIVFPFSRAGSLRYQGPTAGDAVAASESEPTTGEDGGNHIWTMEQESGGDLALYCQNCGQKTRLTQLQIKEEPSNGCDQHLIVLVEAGHAQVGENGPEWVTDRVSLHCKDCGWSASAVPDSEG